MRALLPALALAAAASLAGAEDTFIACKNIKGIAIEPDGTTSPDGYSGFTLRFVLPNLHEGPISSPSELLGKGGGGEAMTVWDDHAWPMRVVEATRGTVLLIGWQAMTRWTYEISLAEKTGVFIRHDGNDTRVYWAQCATFVLLTDDEGGDE